jgi:predicted nucleotidyltransferase
MVTFWIFERYCAAAVNLAVPLNFGTESCTMHKSLNLDEAIVAQFCRQYRVRRLALFGSQLKGTARAGSDIDLLVDFDPDAVPGLLGIAAMELELSRLLGGRKVDLRTAQDLSRHFREEVLRTAEVQYAQ